MLKSHSLILIAAAIGPAVAEAIASGHSRWPQLARLARRGALTLQPTAPGLTSRSAWQRALLGALGLDDARDRYPSAAVTCSGELGTRAAGFWMHATPVHFAAGLERLTVQALAGEHRLRAAESAELEAAIADHLRSTGFELFTLSDQRWLVRSPRHLQASTTTPEAALTGPLEQAMPQGQDAAVLRRLMTELQMVLHEHPVNLRRSQLGQRQVNAIWLHGGGAIDSAHRPRALPQGFGADLYLRGIYCLNETQLAGAPVDAGALLRLLKGPALCVIDTQDLDTLETLWAAPLARALAMGRLARLELVLDRWQIALARTALLKVWRAGRALHEWPAC